MQNRLQLPKDPLLRLLAINALIGVGIASLVLIGIIWSNIGNLRTLVFASDNPLLPLVMLAVALVITLASVVMGSAIMLLGEKRNSGGGGGHRAWISLFEGKALEPIPVEARARTHRRRNDLAN
ncbi:MAG: hypothetical protein JJ979_18835 [Roseibium sp.]|nr:hypothetical protein [Roseibium sp.]